MIERRIYKSGKSQVVAVPTDWATKTGQRTNGRVTIRTYGDLLLVVPSIETKRYGHAVLLDATDPDVIEQRLYSFYLIGTESVSVVAPPARSIEPTLKIVQDRLYGMTYFRNTDKEYIVEFKPEIRPITELLDREFGYYTSMQTQAFRQLQQFPEADDAATKRIMTDYEKDTDKISFQIRRGLINALFDPQTLLSLELEHPADILGYYEIESNLERLSDLQQDISDQLLTLRLIQKERNLQIDLNPFQRLYQTANENVIRSYQDRWGPEVISVIYSKRDFESKGDEKTSSQHEKLMDSLTGEASKIIANPRTNGETADYRTKAVKSLLNLESRIYGMFGNASNISEAWLVMLSRKY